jgi:hypothetical protein
MKRQNSRNLPLCMLYKLYISTCLMYCWPSGEIRGIDSRIVSVNLTISHRNPGRRVHTYCRWSGKDDNATVIHASFRPVLTDLKLRILGKEISKNWCCLWVRSISYRVGATSICIQRFDIHSKIVENPFMRTCRTLLIVTAHEQLPKYMARSAK